MCMETSIRLFHAVQVIPGKIAFLVSHMLDMKETGEMRGGGGKEKVDFYSHFSPAEKSRWKK